jgi:hypothetical protein
MYLYATHEDPLLRKHNRHLRRFLRSKLALALPVTFLILFISTLGIVAFTYYFSVQRISAEGVTLKVSTAKQNMISLNEAVTQTFWQPGSSATYEVADSGGRLRIEPTNNTLTLNLQAGSELDQALYNGSVGKVIYELPYANTADTGLYLKGDSRTIANQSGSSMSQLVIANGDQHVEIQQRYRPSVTYITAGTQDGKTVNNIRIYIVNLNQSDAFALFGKLPLQAVCKTTELTTQTYTVTNAVTALTLTASLDAQNGTAQIPITTTTDGAVLNIETVVCNIAIERWIR